MPDDRAIEALIARMARGEPVDWDDARQSIASDEGRAHLDALRGISRIAAFNHDQWDHFALLLERARGLDPIQREAWLRDLDGADAADVRHALGEHVEPTSAMPDPPHGADADLLAGQVIGAYTLDASLGEGGMGTVWLAHRSDGRFEGQVAVKLLHLPRVSRDGLARFQREGQLLARLRHANIAQLLDAGVTPHGQPYLVLEYVDGEPIDRYCAAHALDVRARIRLFLAVLAAVAHSQANLVVHRDLKPSNILVDRAGTVKLLDFGVGKLLADGDAEATDTELTRSAGRALTPEFAAPEQLLGEPVTTATDVFAAGVVLYLLLTGVHPHGDAQGSPLPRLRGILEATPRPASEAVDSASRRRHELQGDLDNILAMALRKDPRDRYANAAAFAADLRRYLEQEPVAARADTIRYRVGKFVRRNRAAVAGVSAAMIVLAGLTLFSLVELREVRRQRDAVQAQMQRAEGFNTVVTSLLSQVGPGGRALSPGELLDRAVGEVQARYADDPAFLVDMLIRLSGRYFDLGDHRKEYTTLVQAESVARRANDPRLIFLVQINTVETELYLGRREAATRRIEEARHLLPGLHPRPLLDAYLRAEAEVAWQNGDAPGAIAYLERARHELEADDDTHGNAYAGLLSVLRLYHALVGDLREAHRLAQAMVALHERHHRETSAAGTISRVVLAMSDYDIGEVTLARRLYRDTLPEVDDPQEARSGTWVTSHWIYGEMLSRLGRHDEALPLIHAAIAGLRRGGNHQNETRARLALARAQFRAARLPEAQATLDTTLAGIADDGPARRIWLIEADRLQAEVHLAEHHLDRAADEAQRALALIGGADQPNGPRLGPTLLTLAGIQLARNDIASARTSALAAARVFTHACEDPARSADLGEAMLVAARCAAAAGDRAQARRDVAIAAPALASGLGEDHQLTRAAHDLADALAADDVMGAPAAVQPAGHDH